MNTSRDPREVAVAMISRSTCAVKVGAVIGDNWGLHSWGWNSVGAGYGLHAEAHAIKRANPKRLKGSTIWVASTRDRTGKPVISRPCGDCQALIRAAGIKKIFYRDGNGVWNAS